MGQYRDRDTLVVAHRLLVIMKVELYSGGVSVWLDASMYLYVFVKATKVRLASWQGVQPKHNGLGFLL